MKHPAGYRLFHVMAIVFVTTLLVSNTIAVKVIQVWSFTLPAGILVFPVAYIFGDVLTEVYGYQRTRSVIWWGFFCLAVMSGFYYLASVLPPAAFWHDQAPFARLFGLVPRIAVSSFVAYLIGEFLNSTVLSKLKVRTGGRHFWLRAVSSTIVGQGADSVVFNLGAFAGIFPLPVVLFIAFSGFVLKSLYEVIALPLTYAVVMYVKRYEGVDVYDKGISYTPFKLE